MIIYTNKLTASCRVFEKPYAVDSDASELQALALPVVGQSSSGIFVNHFSLDADASEIGLEEWIEPAMLVLNSSALLTREHRNVLDAFHLLQEDSSVQVLEWYSCGHLNLVVPIHAIGIHSDFLSAKTSLFLICLGFLLKIMQKMVMALSTDKTVWDAVMKNEVVQEFKRSFQDGM